MYGTFWLYGGLALVSFCAFYLLVPETKGVSIEEAASRQQQHAEEDASWQLCGPAESRRRL